MSCVLPVAWMNRKHYTLCLLLLLLGVVLTANSALACPDIAGLPDLNCDGVMRIICFGDSITAGEQDSTRLGYPGRLESLVLPGSNVANLGVGGENTSRGRDRAARRFPQYGNADYIIVLEGVNDYFNDNKSATNTRSNLFSMIRSASNVGAVPLLGSLTDVRRAFQQPWVRAVNSQIRSNVRIDFFSLGTGIVSGDKLHPNGNGYQRMAELAANALRAYGGASRPADADQDGIYDFAEARYGTIAGVADSDGDGVNDGQEIFTYFTNPRATDSDSDGFSDYQEVVVRHTNPLSPLPAAPTIQTLQALP